MHMQTSTPLIPKQDTAAQIGQKSKTIRQQLFENSLAKSDKTGKHQWDFINGPHFIDFGGSISDPHDSFFDGRKSDHGTPANHLQLPVSTAAGSDSLINCLRNCSISEIESGSEDTTLKVEDADNTFGGIELIPEIKPVDNETANKSIERRRSTIVHPFSFEMREKEMQEHKQARLQYKMANAKLNTVEFRAKPAPKFKGVPKVKKVMPVEVKNKIVQPATTVPPVNNKILNVFGANSSPPNHVQPLPNNDFMQLNSEDRMVEDVEKVSDPPELLNVKTNKLEPPQVKPLKKKPSPTSQPKRPLTIPRSPNLLTAQRANTWKLIEEQKHQREKEALELQKKKFALKNHRERKEIAEMRKQTVHKALPIPQYRNVIKRPLVDPLNPIVIKRRRKI